MVDGGVQARRATAAATLVAFVLYVVTVSHVHGGDTPTYVIHVREGEWLAWQHMLPHVVAGRLLGFTDHYLRGLGTYPVLCTLDAVVGALVVGLFFQMVWTLTGSMRTAGLAAAGLAVSNTLWATATTYELALFPMVPLLAAALVGLRHRGGARWSSRRRASCSRPPSASTAWPSAPSPRRCSSSPWRDALSPRGRAPWRCSSPASSAAPPSCTRRST